MTVFKAFLKILNKCKVTVLLYTSFLIFFSIFNMQTSEKSTNFVASKPDLLIINEDSKNDVTINLINYVSNNSNIVKVKDDEEAIDDALFYRDVSYIIYVPKNYGEDFLKGLYPKIKVKSTGDYESSYAQMLLSKYVETANTYLKVTNNTDELLNKINKTLSLQTEVEITSKLDTNKLSKATFYYNFMSYSILAGLIYVICLILSSFKKESVNKRTIVSSINYRRYNRILLLSNGLFAIFLWMFYVVLSFILVGDVMFSANGFLYVINSFFLMVCALTIAFLIANVVMNKNAINGIVNVVALGSSFLCGAFVPVEWLPNSVLSIAHVLPSYWYIQTNEILKNMDVFNLDTLRPVLFNFGMIIIFSVIFVILNNFISKRRQKTG